MTKKIQELLLSKKIVSPQDVTLAEKEAKEKGVVNRPPKCRLEIKMGVTV